MKVFSLLLWLVLLPSPLCAQVGLYGMVNANHLSGATSTETQSASSWLYGSTFGVYYTPVHLGPLAAGVDLRGSFASGDNQHLRSGLAGLRVSGKALLLPFRPYIQGSVGVGDTRADSTGSLVTHYTTKFQYAVLGGLDVTLLPRIDLRTVRTRLRPHQRDQQRFDGKPDESVSAGRGRRLPPAMITSDRRHASRGSFLTHTG